MTDPHFLPSDLSAELQSCRLCAERFRLTASGHAPRPVVWFRPGARLLIAGQAPGLRVHRSGIPFDDRSGARLRDWMGVSAAEFYDQTRVAIVPMAFCFPGYDAHGADLPPPALCAQTWHRRVLDSLPGLELTLLIGAHAQKWHLGAAAAGGVTRTVAGWRDAPPRVLPLPHPSWRNTGWLKRNPWFETELLPALRQRVRRILET